MPECSRGGEEHAHQAEERGRGRGGKTKKDKRRQEKREVSIEASRSYWRARLSRANWTDKRGGKRIKTLHPRDDRRTGHLSLESSGKQTKPPSSTVEQKYWRSMKGLAKKKNMFMSCTSSLPSLVCNKTNQGGKRGEEENSYKTTNKMCVNRILLLNKSIETYY